MSQEFRTHFAKNRGLFFKKYQTIKICLTHFKDDCTPLKLFRTVIFFLLSFHISYCVDTVLFLFLSIHWFYTYIFYSFFLIFSLMISNIKF